MSELSHTMQVTCSCGKTGTVTSRHIGDRYEPDQPGWVYVLSGCGGGWTCGKGRPRHCPEGWPPGTICETRKETSAREREQASAKDRTSWYFTP